MTSLSSSSTGFLHQPDAMRDRALACAADFLLETVLADAGADARH